MSRPNQPDLPVRRAGTVALVGRSNVGKSTLLNVLLGEALAVTSPIAQTTRHRILGILRHGDAQIGLLDTPGLHRPKSQLGKRMNEEARTAAGDCDVVLFVADPDMKQKGDLKPSLGDVTLLADIGAGKPTILVLNKIDLVKPRERLFSLIEAFSKLRDFVAVVPIAARKSDGLPRLLTEISAALPEQEALFDEDELTDRPMRFFLAEFVRGEILRVARDELPYAVAVTVEAFDESRKIPRVHATIHVDRDGQKPIVLGAGGSRLRDVGTAARARFERLYGRQIHLELFVRVTPGWADDPRLLDELGYGNSGGIK